MIYVALACSKQKKIGDAIRELAEHGFQNIELSGGTEYYEDYENDIFELKEKYALNLLIHNYFPPPKEEFVLNLASQDDNIYNRSIEHLKQAIRLSNKIGAIRFGFHAGFFIDIKADEIGKTVAIKDIGDIECGLKRFCKGFLDLKKEAGDIKLYVENNVYSLSNFCNYDKYNPFMLTTANDYSALIKKIDFNLLLDIGHLYVSTKTLGLSFEREFEQLFAVSDYIHLSDNDSFHDQNIGFTHESNLFKKLSKYNFTGKTITIEIYSDLKTLKMSYQMISDLLSMKSFKI
jgi:sugar phosphate isomerase/epimerase